MPGQRILLVEDDERNGTTLPRALESTGYDARWNHNCIDGLAAAGERRLDLVLIELGLPDLGGLDAWRSIRRAHDSVVTIILTPRDEELDVVVGIDVGAVDYITSRSGSSNYSHGSAPNSVGRIGSRLQLQPRLAPS